MKSWMKIFLGTLIIFMIVFDIGAYMLSNYAYNYSKDRETQLAIREQNVILMSISTSISRAEEYNENLENDVQSLSNLMSSLSDFYNNQDIKLALALDDKIIYSDFSSIDNELLEIDDISEKNIQDKKIEDKRILFVSSKINEYPDLTFIYGRDITTIDDFKEDIGNYFVVLNIIVLIFITVFIFLLLRRTLKPIVELNKITTQIAKGDYDKRVLIKSKDEISQLANNFNIMANSVEKNMNELKKSSQIKQDFIDSLAHEMKTPITSIKGYSDYLQNANISDDSKILAYNHLTQAVLRLENLSGELSKLTLINSEIIELKEINIEKLFDELTIITKLLLEEKI